jgi:hypothetical protein
LVSLSKIHAPFFIQKLVSLIVLKSGLARRVNLNWVKEKIRKIIIGYDPTNLVG